MKAGFFLLMPRENPLYLHSHCLHGIFSLLVSEKFSM